MKKLVTLALLLSLGAFAVGCEQKKTEPAPETPPATETPAPTETPAQ